MPWIAPIVMAAVQAWQAHKQGQSADTTANNSFELQGDQIGNLAELEKSRFNRQNPGIQMSNALRGDMLGGVQKAGYEGSGRDFHRTGGLSPDLISSGTRQLGQSVSRQALLSHLDPSMESPYTTPKFKIPEMPPNQTIDSKFPDPHPQPQPRPLPSVGDAFKNIHGIPTQDPAQQSFEDELRRRIDEYRRTHNGQMPPSNM